MQNETYFLMLTSAIGFEGALKKAGSVIPAGDALSRNLLHRGKARLATPEEVAAAGFEVDAAPAAEAPASTGGPTERASKGLNVNQIKAKLTELQIEFPADAQKPELAALLDAAPAA